MHELVVFKFIGQFCHMCSGPVSLSWSLIILLKKFEKLNSRSFFFFFFVFVIYLFFWESYVAIIIVKLKWTKRSIKLMGIIFWNFSEVFLGNLCSVFIKWHLFCNNPFLSCFRWAFMYPWDLCLANKSKSWQLWQEIFWVVANSR